MIKSNKMDEEAPEGQIEEAREERPGSICTQPDGRL